MFGLLRGVYVEALPRHFVKEELPRIRYANPKLDIEVNKLLKKKKDHWQPELTLELRTSRFPADTFVKFTTPFQATVPPRA